MYKLLITSIVAAYTEICKQETLFRKMCAYNLKILQRCVCISVMFVYVQKPKTKQVVVG